MTSRMGGIVRILFLSLFLFLACGQAADDKGKIYNNPNFKVKSAQVTHHESLQVSVWEIQVEGAAPEE